MIYGVEYEYTTLAKRPPIQVPIGQSLSLRARGPDRIIARSPQKITLNLGKPKTLAVSSPLQVSLNKTKPQPKAISVSSAQSLGLNVSKIAQKKNLPVSTGEHVTAQEQKTTLLRPHIAQNVTLSFPYTTKAVHFAGAQWLARGGWFTGVSSFNKFVFSCWTKLSNAGDGLWANDQTGNDYFIQGVTSNAGVKYFALNFADSYTDTYANLPSMQSASWQNVLMAADISNADGTEGNWIKSVFVNGTDVTGTSDDDPGFATSIGTADDFYFGTDGAGLFITGDVADVQLWLGGWLDFSVLANRELFIKSGKPVNPSAAAAVLGTPNLLFKGNITDFPVNQGSGGAFTLHGTLTNASTSPSD